MRLSLPVGTQNSWPNRGPRGLQTRNSRLFEMRTHGLGDLGKDCSVNKNTATIGQSWKGFLLQIKTQITNLTNL